MTDELDEIGDFEDDDEDFGSCVNCGCNLDDEYDDLCDQCRLARGPLFPHVRVKLIGEDGNAFSIIARVRDALERKGVPDKSIERFTTEAESGDYDNVLRTCMRWVRVS